MFRFLLIVSAIFIGACENSREKRREAAFVLAKDTANCIGEIRLPAGYARTTLPESSFGSWLRKLPLRKEHTVYLYDGRPKKNQQAQYAVVDISPGKEDLMQCADVVMRLKAQYLFEHKRYGDIRFMDYENNWYEWNGGADTTRFTRYLKTVYGACGSASLQKQLIPKTEFNTIAPGDVLIRGGFPGHAVLVADMAMDTLGHKIFLLIQGYMPAQDIHILKNPMKPVTDPWYAADNSEVIPTPEWQFRQSQLMTWP